MTTIKLKTTDIPEGFTPVAEGIPEIDEQVLIFEEKFSGIYPAKLRSDGKWQDKHGIMSPENYSVIAWKRKA